MSSVFKCDLIYNRSDAGPPSLFAKILRPHAQSMLHAREMGLWEREIAFYERIAPIVDIPTPRCYYTAADPQGSAYVLLLEDISELDQPRTLTREQASLAIRTLARMQAQFWGGSHPALGFMETQQQMQMRLRPLIEKAWPSFVAAFQGRISNSRMDMVRRSIELYGGSLTGAALPPTVVHLDFRPGNMMFGGPCGVMLIDWQGVCLGQGPYDVSRLVDLGLGQRVRAESEDQLVREYYE